MNDETNWMVDEAEALKAEVIELKNKLEAEVAKNALLKEWHDDFAHLVDNLEAKGMAAEHWLVKRLVSMKEVLHGARNPEA